MRRSFAHDAILDLAADGDVNAPGAAVTLALCGSWDHPPPCPLAPHHTAVHRADGSDGSTGSAGELRVRVLFATDPATETQVRAEIERALALGELTGPDGVRTRWRLVEASPGAVRADEVEHAGRLIRS